MSEYSDLDDIIDLRDDDSDTLDTGEGSEDDEAEYQLEASEKSKYLNKTDLELQRINLRLARSLEAAGLEGDLGAGGHLATECCKFRELKVPARIELLKSQLIEEFEMICQQEQLYVLFLCGEIKTFIKNLWNIIGKKYIWL